MAEGAKMGTVTSLDSLFTSEEAEKAARRVEEAIEDRRKELCRLREFISDNSALIHQVRKLPDELSHDIMVPFGSAAFFPGRLIHTNEFLVLLGESYYAERTAKQTVEILQRRGKSLEGHVESLNKIMKDLEAEAKFFDSTAAEVAEGLVEIREEYVEETQSEEPKTGLSNRSFVSSSKAHKSLVPDEEDEDSKLMARLDELEKEEEEAVSDLDDDEDDETASSSDVDEVEDDEYASYLKVDEDEDDEEEDDDDEDEDDENANYLKVVEDEDEEEENDEDEDVNNNAENMSETDAEGLVSKPTGPGTFFPTSMQHDAIGLLLHPSDQSFVSSPKMQVAPEGPLKRIVEQPHATQHPLLPPETREYLQKSPPSNIQAFTGTVIEHSHGLSPPKPSSNDSTSVQPSRPVSRFKMQKGNR
ncbi:hypothetical protein KFK09_000205 [Dendrobium nobile]|uniref:RNA polymerase II subunit 5-mediating protein homolog n=1 Tax=Dendrobium nobile TaxID=94219 RepID=A0A8T3C808_DENNO|nr:hypothetical protein KFK09_000205 [Dendrobium nobile]